MTRFEVGAYSNMLVRSRRASFVWPWSSSIRPLNDRLARRWALQIASIFYETYPLHCVSCSNPLGQLNAQQIQRYCSVAGPER